VLVQVLAQQVVVERVAGFLRAGMGVRVDESGQEPAPRHHVRAGHGVGGPPVAVGEEVDGFAVWERETPHPDRAHSVRSLGRMRNTCRRRL
jgi:hypothetical protein